jgi:anti-sigma factor RsiW
MSEHVTDWLNAYLDGELKGHRLHQVERHLVDCQECRAELESLQDVSALLHEVPAPEFISSERFAAQVNLLLPHEKPRSTKRKVQEAGWWMIPVGLLMLWIVFGAFDAVGDLVRAADRLGILNGAPAWVVQSFSEEAVWTEALGSIGLLSGNSLAWVEVTELFTRNTLPQFAWQAAIALLYLSWIVIWWARQRRRRRG